MWTAKIKGIINYAEVAILDDNGKEKTTNRYELFQDVDGLYIVLHDGQICRFDENLQMIEENNV